MVKEVVGTALTLLILVYIAFIMTQQFCEMTPSYCSVGWSVFGALLIGVIAFLKFGLFSR